MHILETLRRSPSTSFVIVTFCVILSCSLTDARTGIKFNQIQQVGVHGSYHVQPRPKLLKFLTGISPEFDAWQYTHQPLQTLLSKGVRSFQLNVFYDPKGGLYAKRQALKFINQPVDSGIPALSKPGYKVLHIQDLDFESTCWTFQQCLRQLLAWSKKNPRHIPITVKLEVGFRTIEQLAGSTAAQLLQGAAVPLPVTSQSLSALEKEILGVIPKAKVITPDEVRGNFSSLVAAVTKRGWPDLSQLAGRFLFVLNPDSVCQIYSTGNPTLKGKLLFTAPTVPGTPDAAIIAMEPLSSITKERILSLITQNIIVWARADEDTQQARAGNYTLRNLVMWKGAQIVHTDYPTVEAPNPFGTKYHVGLPSGLVVRCNSRTAPKWCQNSMLKEPLK